MLFIYLCPKYVVRLAKHIDYAHPGKPAVRPEFPVERREFRGVVVEEVTVAGVEEYAEYLER